MPVALIIIGILVILTVMLFVNMAKRQRYHGAGERADERNCEEFGTPARSLFTSTKVFSLHHRIQVTDAYETVLYRAESKVISLHDRTTVTRADGTEIAKIWRKVFSLHERHYVEMADGTNFELSNELWHLVKDITNIEGLGWQLTGNILQLNFEIRDAAGRVLATVGQKMFSIHDKYSVDIYAPEEEEKIVAILIALQHMISDRAAAASASSSSGGSSGS